MNRRSFLSTPLVGVTVFAFTGSQVVIQNDVEQYKAQVDGISQENLAVARAAELKLKEWEAGKEIAIKQGDLNLNLAKLKAEVKIQNLMLENLSRAARAALLGIDRI